MQGVRAIHSPNTGITDYSKVAKSFAKDVENMGGRVQVGFEVTDIARLGTNHGGHPGLKITSKNGQVCALCFASVCERMNA